MWNLAQYSSALNWSIELVPRCWPTPYQQFLLGLKFTIKTRKCLLHWAGSDLVLQYCLLIWLGFKQANLILNAFLLAVVIWSDISGPQPTRSCSGLFCVTQQVSSQEERRSHLIWPHWINTSCLPVAFDSWAFCFFPLWWFDKTPRMNVQQGRSSKRCEREFISQSK